MEQVFSEIDDAGIARSDLFLAWDFTVASKNNTIGRMTAIRDEALSTIAGAPAFTVDSIVANPRPGVARRVIGTFDVPLYLKGDGSPGNAFNTGANGLPVRNGTYKADYDCEIPTSAFTTPARASLYGHGLFGGLGEVRSGPQAAMVRDHSMVYCATDWIGMANGDIGNAATILQDISTFNTLVDRSQQGILNFIFLGKLLTSNSGFVSNAAFQNGTAQPLVDTAHLFYDGNSQGAVIGGALIAVSPDIEAGVLGVAGMNYSTLLERSVDFDPFNAILKPNYPDAVDRKLGLQLIQMLWDRGETNGYAAYMTGDSLPGTQNARVMLHVALGDHQVSTLTAEIEARTSGMAVHRPAYAPGRSPDVEPAWNLPAITYPSSGSALVIYDSGSPLSPLENLPPRAGDDPHQDPRSYSAAQQQKSDFLTTGGVINNPCGPDACTAPPS